MHDAPLAHEQTGVAEWTSNSQRVFCYRAHILSYWDRQLKQLLILKILPKSGLICASLKHQSFLLSRYILQLQERNMYSLQCLLKANWQLHFLTEMDIAHICGYPRECMRILKGATALWLCFICLYYFSSFVFFWFFFFFNYHLFIH